VHLEKLHWYGSGDLPCWQSPRNGQLKVIFIESPSWAFCSKAGSELQSTSKNILFIYSQSKNDLKGTEHTAVCTAFR
jgi:hypothetical protein